jgi:hypothetical protein
MRHGAILAALLTCTSGCGPQTIRGALDLEPGPEGPITADARGPSLPRADRDPAPAPVAVISGTLDAPRAAERAGAPLVIPPPAEAPPQDPPPVEDPPVEDPPVVDPPVEDPPVEPPLAPAGPDLTRCAPPLPPGAPEVTYVCDCQPGAVSGCVAGADTHPGTAAAPLRTFAAAMSRFNQLTPGQAVALCRGGAWLAQEARIRRTACTAEAPCALGDYTPGWAQGPAPAPQVTLATPGGTLISVDSGSSVALGGFELRNLALRGAGLTGVGLFFFRTVSDVKLSCLDLSGFDIALNARSFGHDVVLEDSVVHDNGGHGWLGGCDGCGIRRARFDNNGAAWAAVGRGALAHNVYVSGGAAGMFVESVHSTRSAVDAQGRCTGIPITAHGGVMRDLRIVGNLIEEPDADLGCWGISVDGASMDPDGNHDALIANNLLRNVGNVGIGLAACAGCTVENNVIVQARIGGTRAIVAPVRGRDADDLALDRVTVRHNTVYFSGSGQGSGVTVGGEGAEHVVANNIVAFTGQAGDCYRFDLAPADYARVDGNLCFGGTFDVGTTGLDARALTADPQFTAAPGDLSLTASSPAVDSGDPSQATPVDMMGQPRDGRPDRGAYER